MNMTSTRGYLLRAFYEWIVDNQCTPYIAVDATHYAVMVPDGYAENGRIILNISMNAVRELFLENRHVSFTALFGGKSYDLYIPINAVMAIYAKENGKGMVFPEEEDEITEEEMNAEMDRFDPPPIPKHPVQKNKPHLTLVVNQATHEKTPVE